MHITKRKKPVTYCAIPAAWHPVKGKTMEAAERSAVSRGWGEGGMNSWSKENL